MKVFISWSGEKSHKVATVLRDLLPYIIQVIKPFMSSGDILKGERWGDVLAKELEDTKFGIICLTPSNIKAPWLSFEAGALSKSLDRSFVSPFLFQVGPDEIEGPLAQFETTIFAKEDIFNLLTSINNRLESDIRLELAVLRRTFENWWPQLERALLDIQRTYEHESTTGYDWLYGSRDLSEIQLNTNCKSIWVVIPMMRHALQTTCVREVVESNIQRGIKYRFILPLSDEPHAAREVLWRIFSERAGEKQIYEVPQHEFTQSAVTQFILLNPKVEDEQHPLRVFLELPVIGQHNYWIEVEKEAAYTFVERFDTIAAKTGAAVI
jgi:TIR domain